VAVYCEDQEQDIWIWDFALARLTRLTFEPGVDQDPVWTKDGQRLVFDSQRSGVSNLYSQAADNTGMADRLTESPNLQNAGDITPDGTALVFSEYTPTAGWDQMLLTLTRPRRVTPLLSTRFNERGGKVSPDGRWLAYSSDSSGRYEIYVRPFPRVESGQSQVTTAGGTQPRWARSGNELFYAAPDGALMVVPVEARGDRWNQRTPRELVNGHYFAGGRVANYDVSPDGQQFLMIKGAGAAGPVTRPQIVVVSHWGEELKRLVPVR
jgi:serine/threonine-protein kinase